MFNQYSKGYTAQHFDTYEKRKTFVAKHVLNLAATMSGKALATALPGITDAERKTIKETAEKYKELKQRIDTANPEVANLPDEEFKKLSAEVQQLQAGLIEAFSPTLAAIGVAKLKALNEKDKQAATKPEENKEQAERDVVVEKNEPEVSPEKQYENYVKASFYRSNDFTGVQGQTTDEFQKMVNRIRQDGYTSGQPERIAEARANIASFEQGIDPFTKEQMTYASAEKIAELRDRVLALNVEPGKKIIGLKHKYPQIEFELQQKGIKFPIDIEHLKTELMCLEQEQKLREFDLQTEKRNLDIEDQVLQTNADSQLSADEKANKYTDLEKTHEEHNSDTFMMRQQMRQNSIELNMKSTEKAKEVGAIDEKTYQERMKFLANEKAEIEGMLEVETQKRDLKEPTKVPEANLVNEEQYKKMQEKLKQQSTEMQTS